MHSTTLTLLFSLMASNVLAETMKFADSEQGAAFDKCIKIEDYNTKTLDDEVEVVAREEGGCCPDGYTAGAKMYASYQGAQIVCGFKEDGTVATSTGSSNGAKTCTFNSCYVMKQGLPCKEDTKQLLNGCCGPTKKARTFQDSCLSYDYTFKTVYKNEVEYCLSYDKNYGTKGMSGTTEATDDQADGKLVVENLYTYTPCGGGAAGGGGGGGDSSPTATSSAVGTAAGMVAILGMMMA
jgi:hypothetical protein